MKDLFNRLKNSKVFGISAMYLVAFLAIGVASWLILSTFKQKEEKAALINEKNIEIQEIQDAYAKKQIMLFGDSAMVKADNNIKNIILRSKPEYKEKLREALRLENESPSILMKFSIWALAAVLSAVFVTLVLYLMLHFNIAKTYHIQAIKAAPLIYAANLICLTMVLIYLP